MAEREQYVATLVHVEEKVLSDESVVHDVHVTLDDDEHITFHAISAGAARALGCALRTAIRKWTCD